MFYTVHRDVIRTPGLGTLRYGTLRLQNGYYYEDSMRDACLFYAHKKLCVEREPAQLYAWRMCNKEGVWYGTTTKRGCISERTCERETSFK